LLALLTLLLLLSLYYFGRSASRSLPTLLVLLTLLARTGFHPSTPLGSDHFDAFT